MNQILLYESIILTMTIVGAATPSAFAQTIPGISVGTLIEQSSNNSDDDDNTQANGFGGQVISEQESGQSSGTSHSAFVLNALTGNNSNTQTSTQTVTARHDNTVNDEDEQENNQCASGPSVIPIASCANLGANTTLPDIDLGEILGGGLVGGM